MGTWKFASSTHSEDEFLHDQGDAGRGSIGDGSKHAVMQRVVDKLSRILPHGCGVKHHPPQPFFP